MSFGQVYRKAVRIVKQESILAAYLFHTVGLGPADDAVEQIDAGGKRPKESALLLLDNAYDKPFLGDKLGYCPPICSARVSTSRQINGSLNPR